LEFKNDSDYPVFWAEPRKNTIIANEASPFSDNDLVKKFILLHEEGHFKPFDWKIFLRYNTLFVFLAVIILVCTTVIPSLYLIFMILEFFLFFSYGLRSLSKTDEIKSDIYSCTCLKDTFHISKPSDVIKETFIFFRETIQPIKAKNQKNLLQKIRYAILRYYVYTHLPLEAQIAIIEKEVETNTKY